MNFWKRIDATYEHLRRDRFGNRQEVEESIYRNATWEELTPISDVVQKATKLITQDILSAPLYPKAIVIEIGRAIKRTHKKIRRIFPWVKR